MNHQAPDGTIHEGFSCPLCDALMAERRLDLIRKMASDYHEGLMSAEDAMDSIVAMML